MLQHAFPPRTIAATLACCLLAMTATPHLLAQENRAQERSAQDAKLATAFLGERTFMVVKVDFDRIKLPDLQKLLPPEKSEEKTRVAIVQGAVATLLTRAKSLADGQTVYGVASIPAGPKSDETFLYRRVTSKSNTQNIAEVCRDFDIASTAKDGDLIFALPKDTTSAIRNAASNETKASVTKAFELVDEFPVQAVIIPPGYVWRTFRELSPELPRQLGGGPSRFLTDGVQWIAIGFDPESLKFELTIQSASEAAAKELADALPKMAKALIDSLELKEMVSPHVVETVLSELKPAADGDQVALKLELFSGSKESLAVLSAISSTLDRQSRVNSEVQKFKQILVAMHNYHDVHQAFPVADKYRDKKGKPLLSWRVHLLPYVGEAALYQQFHLDEPWDSEHNKKLLAKMPDAYAVSSINPLAQKKPGYTRFLAPVGEKTVFGRKTPAKIRNITDGTSNTIVLVAAKPEAAVPWTSPEDYPFDPKSPLAGIEVGNDGLWLSAFGDGSVRRLSKDISAEMIVRYFEMNDGKPIDQN